MPADEASSNVTLRGLAKYKRIYETKGLELKVIHNKGAVAVVDPSAKFTFLGMMRVLENTLKAFEGAWENAISHAEAHEIKDFPSKKDQEYFDEVKMYYYDTLGFHEQLVQPPPQPPNFPTMNVSQPGFAFTGRTLLPKININKFNGDFSRWPTFKQLFTALVLEEETLSDAERFHFLLSYLDGPPLDTIKCIPVNEANFQQAWQAILQVYDNKRKLASSYIERLISFKNSGGTATADSLQRYLSHVMESMESLKNLNIPRFSDYILCELALRHLDSGTRQAFELSIVGTDYPSATALKDFVQKRCQVLRIMHDSSPKLESTVGHLKGPTKPNKFTPKPPISLLANSSSSASAKTPAVKSSTSFTCHICKQPHIIADCPTFKSSTPAQRLDALKQFEGCRNCLHPFHKTKDCRSKWTCKHCQLRHHSDLHVGPRPQGGLSESHKDTTGPSISASSGVSCASTSSVISGVLLGTIRAKLIDARGKSHVFRGILDAGSQFSFITESCARKLGKTTRSYQGIVSGVNAAPLTNISSKTHITFLPPSSSQLDTEALVVPSITPSLPQISLESSMWHDYKCYDLSDPDFTTPAPISFLIGADLYPEVVTGAPVVIHDKGPRIMETVFGLTVIGRFICDVNQNDHAVSLLSLTDPTFQVEQFWEIEEPLPPPATPMSPGEEACENHFIQSHSRNDGGRYIVSLPFIESLPHIVPNIKIALNRFYTLEAKLAKNDQLRQDYHSFMAEYLQLNHMSLATTPPSYLIPHHPIYKLDVEGNGKLRVVFDASFRTATGSLNDHLYAGPKLQADICTIMLNFRRFEYVFTCDIVKMFRQILVNPDDRRYQQIAWRFDPTDEISYYELNTVTYGVRSSPYQAQRVLRQLALDEGLSFPAAAKAITECIYVDDLAVGSDSIEDLMELKQQLISLLAKGGFELGKWNTNSPSILSDLSIEQQPVTLCDANTINSVTKILGMTWDPQADVFGYSVKPPDFITTKRGILSAIARLYDPLGYLAPVVFLAKCILQETWKSGVDWDDDVPEYVKLRWTQFIQDFSNLASISIPRALNRTDTVYRLVCFCDASESGYCAVAYLQSTQENSTSMTLLKAKTRLAPLKSLTIPRLELCGALLLSQLVTSIQPVISNYEIANTFCFTDSTTVLAWLQTPAHRLQTFVANRTQQILAIISQDHWFHIRGVDNPADVGSRGTLPSALAHHELWWTGPAWCSQPLERWPISQSILGIDVPEMRLEKTNIALATVQSGNYVVDRSERYSSFLRLVRVMAYVRRFLHNARIPKRRRRRRKIGPLSSSEFGQAHINFIKLLQEQHFPEVYKVNSNNELSLELRRLAIFRDHDGVIRVGGRLFNASMPLDQRHPILLPSRSHFTNLVLDHLHRLNNHPGPTAMLAFIRHQYWVPKARNLVRHHKLKCVVCTRFSKSFAQPIMGNLPISRVSGVRPFLNCGVDFAGPFVCREVARRNSRTHKCYLCVFICMASRAVHLELCTSLSVEAFLDVFDRFVARRGIPSRIHSDCGTNFVGASGYLQEVKEWIAESSNQDVIMNHTSHLAVEWSFNPPGSPHFGGSWESAVKSAKSLLVKTLGTRPYSESELHTLFVKIEGVLNSRPLQPLSESADDAEALTPGHFIIGQPINAIPEPDFTDIPDNRLDRWQLIRERVQYFWKRWNDEYLVALQERKKWTKKSPNLQIGDVVIIRSINNAPTHWPLGKIIDVHPGTDDTVRVVTVKTKSGIFKRSAVNLIPLPFVQGD